MFVHLSELLLAARLIVGITQGSLAKACGYTSPQFVSNWERKLCNPPPDIWPILVRELKIPMKDIVDAAIEDYKLEITKKTGYKF